MAIDSSDQFYASRHENGFYGDAHAQLRSFRSLSLTKAARLRLKITPDRTYGSDVDPFFLDVEGDMYSSEEKRRVGYLRGTILIISEIDHLVSRCDEKSQSLYDFAEALEEHGQSIRRICRGKNLLLMETAEVLPSFTGHLLGVKAISAASRYCRDEHRVGIVAMKPFPLQFNAPEADTVTKEQKEEFESQLRKLSGYYSARLNTTALFEASEYVSFRTRSLK